MRAAILAGESAPILRSDTTAELEVSMAEPEGLVEVEVSTAVATGVDLSSGEKKAR
jgi:hypothetical protein